MKQQNEKDQQIIDRVLRDGQQADYALLVDCYRARLFAFVATMVPTRIIRVSGEQLVKRFSQDKKSMDLRCLIAEHLLSQARARYTDLHRATARERYELLLQRCPGIVEHLALQDIASFLNVTPKTISMIRKDITFGKD